MNELPERGAQKIRGLIDPLLADAAWRLQLSIAWRSYETAGCAVGVFLLVPMCHSPTFRGELLIQPGPIDGAGIVLQHLELNLVWQLPLSLNGL